MNSEQTREILRKVRHIEVRTKRLVNDSLAGEYHSVFKGRGMNFDEVREYVPGDEVRTIDWNVTARAGRPFIKKFVEERELTLMLLVDVSASGDFGSGTQSKREMTVFRGAQQRQSRPDSLYRPGRTLRAAAQRPAACPAARARNSRL
jgi:uncharacterized protein (DUF58 family)